MQFHTALARSVVRMIEAADRSLQLGGESIRLEDADVHEDLLGGRHVALA
jgi:hypothetical protein